MNPFDNMTDKQVKEVKIWLHLRYETWTETNFVFIQNNEDFQVLACGIEQLLQNLGIEGYESS